MKYIVTLFIPSGIYNNLYVRVFEKNKLIKEGNINKYGEFYMSGKKNTIYEICISRNKNSPRLTTQKIYFNNNAKIKIVFQNIKTKRKIIVTVTDVFYNSLPIEKGVIYFE